MSNKWHDVVGFSTSVETSPGIWTDQIVEKPYYGEFQERGSRWQSNSNSVNDDKGLINMTLSIVADAFAVQKFHQIKYAIWMGVKWKVMNVKISRPRLIMTLGDVWNEDET